MSMKNSDKNIVVVGVVAVVFVAIQTISESSSLLNSNVVDAGNNVFVMSLIRTPSDLKFTFNVDVNISFNLVVFSASLLLFLIKKSLMCIFIYCTRNHKKYKSFKKLHIVSPPNVNNKTNAIPAIKSINLLR